MSVIDFLGILPAGLAVLLGLIGLTGRWRRVFGYLLCAYAALVIAAQHNAFLAGLAEKALDPDVEPTIVSAAVFVGALIALFVGLLILFGIVWRPTQEEKAAGPKKRRFLGRLIGAALCAAAGWALGAMVALAGLTIAMESRETADVARTLGAQFEMLRATAGVVGPALKPWLPGSLPAFLRLL